MCECEQPYSDYRDGQISPAMAAQREPYLPVLYPWRRERERERERERQRERDRERSTWTKPESWCSRRRPGLREADTSSVTEEKFWSTAPATLTWASRSLHRGGFSLAVKVLDEKARKAFYAIKSCFSQLNMD